MEGRQASPLAPGGHRPTASHNRAAPSSAAGIRKRATSLEPRQAWLTTRAHADPRPWPLPLPRAALGGRRGPQVAAAGRAAPAQAHSRPLGENRSITGFTADAYAESSARCMERVLRAATAWQRA